MFSLMLNSPIVSVIKIGVHLKHYKTFVTEITINLLTSE